MSDPREKTSHFCRLGLRPEMSLNLLKTSVDGMSISPGQNEKIVCKGKRGEFY